MTPDMRDEARRGIALQLAMTILQTERTDLLPVDPMQVIATAEQIVLYLKGERPRAAS